jgi:hypothetical protein
MKWNQRIVTVLVGLSIFFLGYLLFLVLCNFIASTVK